MPYKRKTHHDCRQSVCFFCFSKCDRHITDFIKERILDIFSGNSIDFKDDRVPLGICNSCRAMVQKHGKGDRNFPLPKPHDYNKVIIRPKTRRLDSCNCLICQVGKLKGHSTKLTFLTNQDLKETSSSFDKLCSNCLSVVKRGITHVCSQTTKYENLKKMIATDSRTAEKFASSVITQKVSSPQGTIRLSRESGKALTITPGTSRAQCISRTSLTTLDMVQVQINTGLSNKKMQELAVTLNKTTNSKIVETKFRENFTMAG